MLPFNYLFWTLKNQSFKNFFNENLNFITLIKCYSNKNEENKVS